MMIEMIPWKVRGRLVASAPGCAPCRAPAAPAGVRGAVAADGAPARVGFDGGGASHHQARICF
jgi:hypothetical protein